MKLFGRWPVAGSVALVRFHKLTRYFCDADLTDAFIDNALFVAWDFQRDAVIFYGFNPMIAEILRRKNKKFLFLVENSFEVDSLQRSEETLFTLDAFG